MSLQQQPAAAQQAVPPPPAKFACGHPKAYPHIRKYPGRSAECITCGNERSRERRKAARR